MSGIGHRSPPLRQPSTASTSSAVAAATSGGAGAGASSSNSTGIGGGGGGGGAATGLGGGAGGTSSNAGFFASSSVASRALHFRRLVWDATIPIAVSVDAAELPGSITLDRAIETYYVRAPRISYLPLVLEKVRAGLLSLMLSGDAALDSIKPDSCWFSFEGIPLRWWVQFASVYADATIIRLPYSYPVQALARRSTVRLPYREWRAHNTSQPLSVAYCSNAEALDVNRCRG